MVERLHPTPIRLVVPDERTEPIETIRVTAEALRELAAALNRLAEDHHHTAVNVEIIGHEVQRIGAWVQTMPPRHATLPPMREEAASSLDLAEHVGRQVAERVEAEKANPSTPPPDAAKVAAISKDVIAAAIMQLKAEQWDKLEKERKAAEKERLEDAQEKRRLKRQTVASGILAGVGLVAYLLEHFLR